MDDNLVSAPDNDTHDNRLREVYKRLSSVETESCLTVKPLKNATFMQNNQSISDL